MIKKFSSSFVLWLFACNAMTNQAGHDINWWHLGAEYKDAPALGWLSITFAIFLYTVVRVVKKPLSLYLETRSNDIRRQIEEGRLAKIDSEKKLKLYDEKLRSLASDVEKMKHVFREQAEAEKIERQRLAKEMEERILRDADDTIRANMERAKNRIAQEVIGRATLLAEHMVSEKKNEEIDDFLKGSFIADLRESAAGVKRGYMVNELVNNPASVKKNVGSAAREVH